nr:helicase swr1 [Quercus suber]
MSATSAPDREPALSLTPTEDDNTGANSPARNASNSAPDPRGLLKQGKDAESLPNAIITVKNEESEGRDESQGPMVTRHTVVQKANKRDSETGGASSGIVDKEIKKRKRGPSPPWQFPSVEAATMKSADGRRVSARVNITPVLSESEGHSSRPRSESRPISKSRPASPPWKGFAADGPTSIHVDGKRKSGRVNKDLPEQPKRVSPRNKKQIDKLADEPKEARRRPRGATTNASSHSTPKKAEAVSDSPPPVASSARTIASLQAQLAALKPARSFSSPAKDKTWSPTTHKRKRSNDARNHTTRSVSHANPTPKHEALRSSEVTRPPTKIRLRLNSTRQAVPPPHPSAMPPSPARPPKINLFQILDEHELREMQQPFMENERGPPSIEYFNLRNEKLALEEATMRKRILKAVEPGNILSKECSSIYHAEAQPEIPTQYGHHDHLVAQALWLRQLQMREKTAHRLQAKKIAYEALEYWKAMRGPTEEDIKAEQDKIIKLVYKQVVVDVQAKWEMVSVHVQQLRKDRWEAEETLRRQARLQRQLERSEQMIARQRGDYDSDINTDDEDEADSLGADDDASELDDSSDENMSESGSNSDGEDEEQRDGEMGSDELAHYLAHRDAEPPDKLEDDFAHDEDEEMQDIDRSEAEGEVSASLSLLGEEQEGDDDDAENDFEPQNESAMDDEQVQEVRGESELGGTSRPPTRNHGTISPAPDNGDRETDANLSSDESVDMYDSDEDMSSGSDEQDGDVENEEAEVESDAGNDEAEQSMLGFLFTSKQIKAVTGLPTPTTSTEGDKRDRTAEVTSDDNVDASGEAAVPGGLTDTKVTQLRGSTSIEPHIVAEAEQDLAICKSPADDLDGEGTMLSAREPPEPHLRSLVPIPSLLVAQLRSYQHAGLDWLASLYRSDTNGILADEMGLGKTIQTISLLAHIAEQYDVWEAHLIIVPTSVVLNWVTEFQKFLPGFRVLGYYGNIEERAAKRKHWANDPHHPDITRRGYNVVVTSYSVAQQDMNALKVVKWHYMVLDEAHNIRNFQSLRWQNLIKINTKARLLLTGTPLQNSLTELWSLLTFLTAGDDDPAHGNLEEFLSHWKEPVKEIFESGVTALSTEAQKVVDQLHISLRPFLLRRLKSEVEKDLPKKIESVVVCKLSKRQRQLYQEYMGLASTRESLQRGNAVTAGSVLLSLRKVCNHPDLFDPRPIQTSFAMQDSAAQTTVARVSLVQTMFGAVKDLPAGLMISAHESRRKRNVKRSRQLAATRIMKTELSDLEQSMADPPDAATMAGCLALQRLRQRESKLQVLRESIRVTEESLRDVPVYGSDLREVLTVQKGRPYVHVRRGQKPVKSSRMWLPLSRRPLQLEHPVDAFLARSTDLQQDVLSLDKIAESMKNTIVRFAFCTPVATAPVLDLVIQTRAQDLLRESEFYPHEADFAHEARTRTSIAFPDSRLLIYDAGKLQRLTKLLRELQSRGSRSLIFTQMTGTLDVLERFLNLLNLPYLRLDGSTPIEKRQLYAAEFNRPDSRYQCMILSSRAGGVGLNLTGASSVIFYDLDWNPQMDRQCMDRAHRIGQMRDVEVYKMVSEKTVEENILRRANQKSLLDQTVIQEGHFTTEYQASAHHAVTDVRQEQVMDDAIERYLGGSDKARMKAMESVEDREDFQAAQRAGKEEKQDELEFAEHKSSNGPSAAATPGPVVEEETPDGIDRKGHVDSYMIREVERWWARVPYVPAPVRRLDKHGRDPSHRPKKRR